MKTVLTRKQSTQHHGKRHPMVLKYKVGADAEGHLLANHSASHPLLSRRFDDNPELLIAAAEYLWSFAQT